VLCVGRLAREKAQRGLLDAFASVLEQGVDAELRIVGEGPERPHLEAAVAALGLAGRVTLPGAVAEEAIPAELAAADVFALSSVVEGLPVVLMEAMAHGVPVVAPRLAGIPELVEHERTGLLYAPTDWTGLAEHLVRLLRRPEERDRLAKEARVRVAEEFEIGRAVEPLLARFRAEGGAPERR
jgi:glycosyltransferase involved in cell wall biosynthesis